VVLVDDEAEADECSNDECDHSDEFDVDDEQLFLFITYDKDETGGDVVIDEPFP